MRLAIIRVRGIVNVDRDFGDTLRMLRLYTKNYCVVMEGTPQIKGMINKVKHLIKVEEKSS